MYFLRIFLGAEKGAQSIAQTGKKSKRVDDQCI
jgi:hypothetical protein